jgi:hypothetical protein
MNDEDEAYSARVLNGHQQFSNGVPALYIVLAGRMVQVLGQFERV